MLRTVLGEFRRDDRGASMVEYALLVALVAAVIAVAATTLGTKSSTSLSNPDLLNKLQ